MDLEFFAIGFQQSFSILKKLATATEMIQLHFTADAASTTTIKYFFEETHGAAAQGTHPKPQHSFAPRRTI